MKKLITFAATVSVLVMLGLSSVTASAASPCAPNSSGGFTCTVNAHGVTMLVGPPNPPCIPPDATGLVSNENLVMHITVNSAGNVWFTFTAEGDVTLTVPSTGTIYTGHFMIWDGGELNNRNSVSNMTFNAHLTAPDGSTLDAHFSAGVGVSASNPPQPIMHFSLTC